jgi:hypothetical protein
MASVPDTPSGHGPGHFEEDDSRDEPNPSSDWAWWKIAFALYFLLSVGSGLANGFLGSIVAGCSPLIWLRSQIPRADMGQDILKKTTPGTNQTHLQILVPPQEVLHSFFGTLKGSAIMHNEFPAIGALL